MRYRLLVAGFAFVCAALLSFCFHKKVDTQEQAVESLKEEAKPIIPPTLHRNPIIYPDFTEVEVVEAYASGGEDRKGVFFLQQHGYPIKYKLLDPTFKPIERGWAMYDPRNKTWVVEIDGYRFGLK